MIMIKSIHFYNSVLHDFRLTQFGGTDYQANLSISKIVQKTDLKMNELYDNLNKYLVKMKVQIIMRMLLQKEFNLNV